MKKITQRVFGFQWTWMGLALALRLGFALRLGNRFYQIDESGFDGPAWNLASLGILGTGEHPLVASPVPSFFFALFYRLFGHLPLFPRLGQALASTLTAWMIGRMAEELTGSKRAGLWALAISAVYPFFIYYSGILMSETLYLAAVVPGLWWLSQSLAEGGSVPWKAPAAGFSLALAALCRAEGAPISAVIWAAAALACLAGRFPWRSWCLAVLCWALPLLGWCVRNKAATGSFAMDQHGGITLLIGTAYFEENEIDTAVAMEKLQQEDFYKQAVVSGKAASERLFLRRALAFMLQNPGKTLKQWGRKLVNFWRFYPRTDKPYHETALSHPGVGLGRPVLVLVSLLFEPCLILGGLAGLWKLKGRWKNLFPVLLFLLGSMAIHMVSVSQMRYRLPVMPVLILGVAALADCRLWETSSRDSSV